VRQGRIVDTTAATVAENALGDAVLASVLPGVEDPAQRTLLLAHVALGLPVPAVARAYGLDPKTVEAAVETALRRLRTNEALRVQLTGIRHAGRPEHFLALAERLKLQDWLCARCGRPMEQKKVGRPRKTCSDSCRVALSLAGGHGWKDAKDPAASTFREFGRGANPQDEMRRILPFIAYK
jgi:hypothetical protein